MPQFLQESLENLRQKIDLIDVLSSHLELKPAGATYKALCPFHDEKSPSFTVRRGDSHYHCFGCGAHGDAIAFLMNHQKLSFLDAVESLAKRFHVHLEQTDEGVEKGPNKARLKEALDAACRLYHFLLLHTPDGHKALHYLYRRGIDLDFIKEFQIGLALSSVFRQYMWEKGFNDQIMQEAGLLSLTQSGQLRDFFSDRITFPIRQATGEVIGFSARKYKEETFGGKYINTPETPLFKKSRILFGLNYSRKRIAKERKVIVVEGQIDTLRLIQRGFNYTVAAGGTAFGEGHVRELVSLGVQHAYLALDGDLAGQEACCKVGDLFQHEGIEVSVVNLPEGSDPDSFIREGGDFNALLEKSQDYLSFIVHYRSQTINIDTPAGKNELIQRLSAQIRRWSAPLMVHESLRKLAHLTQVPEEMLGIGINHLPNIYIKKSASIGHQEVDPHLILEGDLLRWFLLMAESHPRLIEAVKAHLAPEDFRTPLCRKLYQVYLDHLREQKPYDWLSIAITLDDPEGQQLMSDLLQKKVKRSEESFCETVQKILDRNWMYNREQIKMRIQSGQCSDEEVMELIKQFDKLKPSKFTLPEGSGFA